MTDTQLIFALGFLFGNTNNYECSIREADYLEIPPTLTQAFINGTIDGRLNDTWRLNLR